MKTDVISEVIAALRSDDPDTRAYAASYLDEVAQTRAGHWHPPVVLCTAKCPMGDPRTREAFAEMLWR
jgi:hypothetical protein